MKTEFITLDKALDLQTVVEVENDTQRILREALMRLGPNGEHWCQVAFIRDDGAFCAIGSLIHAMSHGGISNAQYTTAKDYLARASEAFGHPHPMYLNDSAHSFSEVRSMFELAISLAASPKSIT